MKIMEAYQLKNIDLKSTHNIYSLIFSLLSFT